MVLRTRRALYALRSEWFSGDFALTRDEMEFLMRRQRDDGKMMHEYSQTAGNVDWKALPYMYAAADATPLFFTAMLDYVRSSGDVDFLKRHRESVEKAWQFEITHDSDRDGIYDNAQGTGWVESWPLGMPHQEIYLALLDQQASAAMARLASLLDDKVTADSASKRADELAKKIETEYYDPTRDAYAFSRNRDGRLITQPRSIRRLRGGTAATAWSMQTQAFSVGLHMTSQPIGVCVTLQKAIRCTIQSVITRGPCGHCLLGGPQWRSIEQVIRSQAMKT